MSTDVPVFEVWEHGQSPIDTAVGFHHREVGIAAAGHLIGRERASLCFLGARVKEDRRAKQRAAGFVHGVTGRGLRGPPVLEDPGGATVEAGSRLLARALQENPELDGIACSNDLIALGALFECQRRGVAVPDRIGVMGFGDLLFSAGCVPSLTTIKPPGDEIGRKVGQLILERLNGAPSPPVPQAFDLGFALIAREST